MAVDQEETTDLLDENVVKDLEVQQFRYRNPIDIRNLRNYLDEEVVGHLSARPRRGDVGIPAHGGRRCNFI